MDVAKEEALFLAVAPFHFGPAERCNSSSEEVLLYQVETHDLPLSLYRSSEVLPETLLHCCLVDSFPSFCLVFPSSCSIARAFSIKVIDHE
jgi:hypothetical protein